MKKIIIQTILLGCIAIFFASCGGETKANNNLSVPTTGNNGTCHTILVSQPLATSVVAKEDVIHTGQSVNGAVKDHSKYYPGYTKEMFMADNPQIAGRPVIRKLDPCDSTKVKYIGVPLYSGDVVRLRLPYRIDTIPGYAESIIWKPFMYSSKHIMQIIDIDEKGRVMVEHQNICCNGVYVNPCPPQMGDGILPPVNVTPPSDTVAPPTVGDGDADLGDEHESETPWWVWLMLGLLVVAIVMIAKNKKADPNSVGNITEAVQAEGQKTRAHVTKAMDGLGGKMDIQTAATKEQTETSKETNLLLKKWMDQNTPK